jgi:hypothetical protein
VSEAASNSSALTEGERGGVEQQRPAEGGQKSRTASSGSILT